MHTLTHAVGVDAREHRRIMRAHRIADSRILIERFDASLMKVAIRTAQRQSERQSEATKGQPRPSEDGRLNACVKRNPDERLNACVKRNPDERLNACVGGGRDLKAAS